MRPRRIGIVGTGYVGTATAIGLAYLGHSVVGYDIIRERVRGLSQGVSPYAEAGINAALQEQLHSGRLKFVEELPEAVRDADYVIVAVGTPSRPDGGADLSFLDAAIESLEGCLDGASLVLRCTVPVGTSDRVAFALGERTTVLFAPEFLREGSALPDFLAPDRIVVGSAHLSEAEAYCDIFSGVDVPRIITTLRNAELIKGFSNAFLATKISFANEVANFCELVHADALEVLAGVGSDHRIGSAFLHPGIGFGGPCFEKDVRSLQHQAAKYGASDRILAATIATNDRQPKRVREILEFELGSLGGKRIGVWGLTFKGGTDDVRDSLATRVIEDLAAAGAQVLAYDPAVSGTHALVRCDIATSAVAAIENADALVVLTDWNEFRQIDAAEIARALRHALVVDGRNLLDARQIAAKGVRYRSIGRPQARPSATEFADGDGDEAVAV